MASDRKIYSLTFQVEAWQGFWVACEGLIPSCWTTLHDPSKKKIIFEHPFKGVVGFGFPFTTRSIQMIWIEWEGFDIGIVFVSFPRKLPHQIPSLSAPEMTKTIFKKALGAQTYNKHIQQRHADSGFYKTWGKPAEQHLLSQCMFLCHVGVQSTSDLHNALVLLELSAMDLNQLKEKCLKPRLIGIIRVKPNFDHPVK